MAPHPSTHGIRGLAAIFGNLDSYGTIVDPGAFADEEDAFDAGGFVPGAYSHVIVGFECDLVRPLGLVTELGETQEGLYYEITVSDDPVQSYK